ncbi:hypothetical protein PMAYCL1PPCAC_08328, partial [Pristionchus mayeri]
QCEFSTFTVIRKVKTIASTPQCVVNSCEKHPSTIHSYASHLLRHHKTSLKKERISLICDCGYEATSDHQHNHDQKCDGKKYTLNKLDE